MVFNCIVSLLGACQVVLRLDGAMRWPRSGGGGAAAVWGTCGEGVPVAGDGLAPWGVFEGPTVRALSRCLVSSVDEGVTHQHGLRCGRDLDVGAVVAARVLLTDPRGRFVECTFAVGDLSRSAHGVTHVSALNSGNHDVTKFVLAGFGRGQVGHGGAGS